MITTPFVTLVYDNRPNVGLGYTVGHRNMYMHSDFAQMYGAFAALHM